MQEAISTIKIFSENGLNMRDLKTQLNWQKRLKKCF